MAKGGKKPKAKTGSGKSPAVNATSNVGLHIWENAVRNTTVSDTFWSCRLFMVAAADSQYYDLLDRVSTAVFTGRRRSFVLIDYQDLAEQLLASRADSPDHRRVARSTARHRDAPQEQDPVQELYSSAGAVLQETGAVPAALLAAVIKMELATIREQKTAVVEIELPGASSKKQSSASGLSNVNDASGAESKDSSKEHRRSDPKTEAKQVDSRRESKHADTRRESRRPSGAKSEGRGRRKTIKEVKLEDELMHENRQDDDNFCKKRLTKLKKRGETDESPIILGDVVIKEDEPVNGPDLYVILVGFLQPDLPVEMEKNGVPVEVLFRILTKPAMPAITLPNKTGEQTMEASSSLDRSKQSSQSIAKTESDMRTEQLTAEFVLGLQIPLFWDLLQANIKSNDAAVIPPNFIVKDLVMPLLTIKCITEQRQVGDILFDMLASEIYDHLKMRAIFDCYLKSLQVTELPDIGSVFRPETLCSPEEQEEDDVLPLEDGQLPAPRPQPVTPPAQLYRQRLQSVPPEAVSVPMIVNALVDQVVFWLDGDFFDPVDAAFAVGSDQPSSQSSGLIGDPSGGGGPELGPPGLAQWQQQQRLSSEAEGRRGPAVTIQGPEGAEPPLLARERRGSLQAPGGGQQGGRGSLRGPEPGSPRQRRASALPALAAEPGRRASLPPAGWSSSGRARSLPLPQLLLPSSGQLAARPSSDTLQEEEEEPPQLAGPWLRRRFAVTQPIAEAAPVLVYHCDRINTQFYNRTDRTVIHQLEHVLRHNFQLLQLQAAAEPPDGSFLKHQAAKQELLAELPAVVTSAEHMEYLLRLLMFESLYPGLSTSSCSPQLRHHRHPSLPAPHVTPDTELLLPECGHGAESSGLRQLNTAEETAEERSRFSGHCWLEPLDPLSMAQTLFEAQCGSELLAASHFEGDDGLYLVYGHPQAYGGFTERRWSSWQHTTVGLRDFFEHSCRMPEVARWLQREVDRMKRAEQQHRDEAERRREIERLRPIPPPPQMEREVPDEDFINPSSIKGQRQEAQARSDRTEQKEEGKADSISENRQPQKKIDDVKKKPTEGKGDKHGEIKDTSVQVTIQLTPRNKRQQRLTPSRLQLLDAQPPREPFRGFDLSGKLAHVSGRQYRQYFDNGSYMTVETKEHMRGPRYLSVSVSHGGTSLHVHPNPQGEDVVVHLLGGAVMHLLTRLLLPGPPAPKTPSRPSSPGLAPTRRGSPLVKARRSPASGGKDKKENKKEKEDTKGKKKPQDKKSRSSSGKDTAAKTPTVEEPEPEPEPTAAPEPLVLHALRVSCPSGLVVELEPEPPGAGPEPRLLVRQYRLDAAGRRCGVRLFLSEGLLCRLEDGEQGGADLLRPDGSVVRCQCVQETPAPAAGNKADRASEAPDSAGSSAASPAHSYRLVPVSVVRSNGERRTLASKSSRSKDVELPKYLSKIATDPVTKEMYVVRQDGVSAVLRPGGFSAVQHSDGTRLSLRLPTPAAAGDVTDQSPVCSDYIATEAGWVLTESASWVLGMRVLLGDAAEGQWDVQTEHPDYCRVLMRQRDGVCEVHLPQGAVIEARSSGSYTIRQADDTFLQVDPEAMVFTAPPSAPGEHPTVHTIPLSRPPPPPPPPPPASPQPSATAPPEPAATKTEKRGPSRGRTKTEPPPPPPPPEQEPEVPPEAEKQPEEPVISATVCETVDGRRRVFRATRNGRLVKVNDRATCPASGLTLALRAQLERDTVLPLPPRLLVLYRSGDGLELVTASEVTRYLGQVRETAGGQVWSDPHSTDPEVRTVRAFRPVPPAELPHHRWKMPYAEETLVPPNLRNRDLSLMCKDKEPVMGSLTWWGGGDGRTVPGSTAGRPPPVELVQTRELLQIPPVQPEMYRTVVRAVHLARLRGQRTAAVQRPVVVGSQPPPPKRAVHLYESNKLIEWLETAKANHKLATSFTARPPKQSPEFWEKLRSQAAKVQTQKEMLRTQQFPAYFQSSAGAEFLGRVRQSAGRPLAPALCRGVSERRLVLGGGQWSPPPGTLTCRPAALDLGAVRRRETAAGRLRLSNAGSSPVRFRLRPPAPLLRLRVEPRSGSVPAGGELPLLVSFEPEETMAGRSVFFRLELALEGGLQLLAVPVVACVAGADSTLPRLPPFSLAARASSVR